MPRKNKTQGLRECKQCGKIFDHAGRNLVCSTCKGKERRELHRQKATEYLGGKCKYCGYNRCIAALDFHHRDPLKKETEIGRIWQRSWNRIKEELDKCDLVCSNCHREIHAGLIV